MHFQPLEVQAILAQLYPGFSLQLQPYGYPVTIASLAPAATSTTTVNISSNADFLLLAVRHRATIAAAAQNVGNKTAPCVRMLVTDSGSGEQFTSAAVDLENYSTNAHEGPELVYPRLLQGRTSLTVQVTSYAAAETYAPLEIFFEGILVRAYRDANSPGVILPPSGFKPGS